MKSATGVDWVSRENHLFLNPRLPQGTLATLSDAWRELVEPRFRSVVGIATSGSSGESRGKVIVLSKEAILASAESVNDHFAITERDVWMKTLPDFHVGGLGIFARAFLSRSSIVQSRLESWDVGKFHAELEASSASLLSLVPAQVFDLVVGGFKAPKSLRAVIVGGARLDTELYSRALELGWPLYPSYGLTECASQVATASRSGDPRLRPLAHVKIRVGVEGHLEIQSRALLSGWIIFENGSARFRDVAPDAWFRTEDRGQIADDGSLEVLGRVSDFVKIGGEGVNVARLENLLEKLRATGLFSGDVAVVAAADDRLGAGIVFLSDKDEMETRELVARFNAEVAPFERVRSVVQIEGIPRTPLGKLMKREALSAAGLKPAGI